MKKNTWLAILATLILLAGSIGTAYAQIIPPSGEGQIGTGAVVLSEQLTVYEKADSSSKAVETLQFGDHFIVTEQADAWARGVLGDSEDSASGWVSTDSLLIDPAWYMTEAETPVYTQKDTLAPVLDVLDEYTLLAILKDEGEWIAVGLNGAEGWINVIESGERFEGTIMLEGMEETVKYERIRSDALGFEMAYDFENFVRLREPEGECFVSLYDDIDNPENYLKVTYSEEDADTAVVSIGEALSKDYDIIVESLTLDGAGACTRIDASEAKGSKGTPDQLQSVYIIPAGEGSIIAEAHCAFEAAEGFGHRFDNMVHTIVVLNDQD